MTSKFISIRGAREHNLKNISLDLPREKLVVITGLSGSGKSSLAFDTIYAEGQRRYVESLAAYARQFLDMMQKPDVDHIDGLSPAISIEQKTTSRNPRSTVGTVTEIYDYMRLLFARVGVPYSPATGLPIESQTVSQMVDRVLALPEGTRLYLLAPIARGRKGEYRKEFAELQKKGFQRLKIDGTFYEIGDAPALDKKFKHDIDVVVDRVVVRPDMSARLADSFETALALSDGIAVVEFADRAPEPPHPNPLPQGERGSGRALPQGERESTSGATSSPLPGGERDRVRGSDPNRIIFSAKFACPVSGFTIEEIEPRLFSFNNPYGACPACDGLGTELFFEPDLVVPDENLSLNRGAIAPWARTSATSPYYQQTLESLARAYRQPMTKPWKSLPEDFRNVILYGSGDDEITFNYDDGVRHYSTTKPFEGRDHQYRAALARDRILLGAGGAVALPVGPALRGLHRLSAQAAGAGGEDRRPAYRASVRHVDPRGLPLVRDAPRQAHAQAERDRRAHPEGDPRAAELLERRRPRLSHPRPRERNALGRREPAHPPRLADRLWA